MSAQLRATEQAYWLRRQSPVRPHSTNERVKVKFHPTSCDYGTERERESLYLYSFFDFVVRWGWVINATPRPLYARDIDPVPVAYEAGWDPG